MKFTYTTVPGELKENSIVELKAEYLVDSDGKIDVALIDLPIIFLSMIADGSKLYININIAAHLHFAKAMKAA